MEKLPSENTRDNATTCEKVGGPCELIRRSRWDFESSKNDEEHWLGLAVGLSLLL